jgi:hypothetical protein
LWHRLHGVSPEVEASIDGGLIQPRELRSRLRAAFLFLTERTWAARLATSGGQARMVFLGRFQMKALGLSMIVGGVACLFSGLIFLLPTERKLSARKHSLEESQAEIEYYLSQMRKERE